MIDDGIKSALLPLDYNIGASGREEYKGKQERGCRIKIMRQSLFLTLFLRRC